MPTVVELAGATYPREFDGHVVAPMEGQSLVPVFAKDRSRDEPIYWEFAGNHAIRDGKWKLVAERSQDWELYDLSTDRSEAINLTDTRTDKAEELAAAYDAWARRVGAKTHAQAMNTKPSNQSQLFQLP
jgi:arylsulfatase